MTMRQSGGRIGRSFTALHDFPHATQLPLLLHATRTVIDNYFFLDFLLRSLCVSVRGSYWPIIISHCNCSLYVHIVHHRTAPTRRATVLSHYSTGQCSTQGATDPPTSFNFRYFIRLVLHGRHQTIHSKLHRVLNEHIVDFNVCSTAFHSIFVIPHFSKSSVKLLCTRSSWLSSFNYNSTSYTHEIF